MTNQEAFDKVWDHFITKRNPPAYTASSRLAPVCLYRSAAGPCAVGVLIPDDVYQEEFEGFAIWKLWMGFMYDPPLSNLQALRKALGNVDLWLLSALQRAHDSYAYTLAEDKDTLSPEGAANYARICVLYGESPEWFTYFLGEMQRVAREFDLKVPSR